MSVVLRLIITLQIIYIHESQQGVGAPKLCHAVAVGHFYVFFLFIWLVEKNARVSPTTAAH